MIAGPDWPPRGDVLRTYALAKATRDLPAVQPFRSACIRHCARDQLGWADPMPSPDALQSFYASEYRAAMGKDKGLPRYRASPNYRAQARSQVEWLAREVGESGTLLDVGAGYGLFLSEAHERLPGWSLAAVEPDRDAAADLTRIARLERDFTGFWEGGGFAAGSLDAINLSHVLEHLRDPLGALVRLRALLRPGGVLQVETPHDDLGELLRSSRQSDLPHLWFFSRQALENLVERAGFTILRSAVLGIKRPGQRAPIVRRLRRFLTIRLKGPLALLDDVDWYAERPDRTDVRVLCRNGP
jgi:SAM-dependent methyltransferase